MVLVDGLALGVMPRQVERVRRRLDLVALVHHPLCLETGLSPRDAEALERSERAALATARTVVVTSPRTADTLVSLMAVPAEAIIVAVPGTDAAPVASGSRGGILRLLCVGTVVPRKGQALLVEALGDVPGRWELTIAGSLEADPVMTDRLRAAICDTGLGERIHLVGELAAEALAAHYDASDLFVSASLYEGYGMALTEALARGLPIVAAAGGAVVDTVPPAAGLLVPPGDARALRAALTCCVSDASLLARLREGALAARKLLPRWPETAASVERALLGGVL
jgi:glycosyltransferase involved in cell wall biosynthesis